MLEKCGFRHGWLTCHGLALAVKVDCWVRDSSPKLGYNDISVVRMADVLADGPRCRSEKLRSLPRQALAAVPAASTQTNFAKTKRYFDTCSPEDKRWLSGYTTACGLQKIAAVLLVVSLENKVVAGRALR